ncbi:hypothetical protein M8818_007539 [Zalaria obscura]|uniref:Uncharacterized protein n=1 Tax=Zalaria obscura TaxID=2024903 RepID=A0ACC3S3Y0_9PEZI
MQEVDILILGAGWTSTFLIPLLRHQNITYAATSTTGRDSTIRFKFDPSASDQSYFSILPTARNVLITFPLTGAGQSKLLVESYKKKHPRASPSLHFLQLGSTGIWQIEDQSLWVTRHSKYDGSKPRAVAEDELLGLGGCVLNLAGLWGGERQPRHWVERVASTKEKLAEKASLHMVHGEDVARAIVKVFQRWDAAGAAGERWMLTDGFVYDWWALFAGWASSESKGEDSGKEDEPSRQSVWVYELMEERGVRALPRSMEQLGRAYDSRDFWQTFGLSPARARI